MTDINLKGTIRADLMQCQRLIAVSAMIGSAACWGSATVMSRDLLSSFTPTLLLVVQLCASVVVLLLISFASPPWRFLGRGIGKAALVGILEPGLAYTVGLWGLSMTTASSASLIGACEPIVIVLVAWILLRQRPSLRLIVAISVAVVGLLLVSAMRRRMPAQARGWEMSSWPRRHSSRPPTSSYRRSFPRDFQRQRSRQLSRWWG